MTRVLVLSLSVLALGASGRSQEGYLAMDAKRAQDVALSTRSSGQVGKSLDLRILKTDRSYNYKLRATWMTPEVVRANARRLQLIHRLSDDQTRALVSEAEEVDGTVILVEIDPREGSGVIPRDWLAILQPRGETTRSVTGVGNGELRNVRALASAARRDYSYDLFWIVFPLRTAEGGPLFEASDREVELVVQIYDKIGKVRWNVPDSIRAVTDSRQ